MAYLKPNTVMQLVSLRKYVILLISQDRPADQKYNPLHFILDEQWFNLTAHDMKTGLVKTLLENHRSQTTPGTPMSNFTSPSSSVSMRLPINWELASFKRGLKIGAYAYSILRDECHFDKFQKNFFITAKSDDVSEILDPTFTPGPSQEDKELFEAKQSFMYNVFRETLLTNMGRYIVRIHLRTIDAQAVWKEYSEYIITTNKGVSEKRRQTPEEKIIILTLNPSHIHFLMWMMVQQLCQINSLLHLEGRKIISLNPKL